MLPIHTAKPKREPHPLSPRFPIEQLRAIGSKGGYGTSAKTCAASMRTFTAPTGRCGQSSIRESCLTRCPLLHTGRAWAASGSMCEVTPCATPTGSNEPLYGRTDTKSRTASSSMVHVSGGEEGSTRHDDEGRLPSQTCRASPDALVAYAARSSVLAHDSNAPILPRMLRNCGVSSDLVIRPTLGATEHEILTADLRLAE